MRSLILVPITLVPLAACTSAPPLGAAPPASVRDHLASPTRLLVSATQSTGSITASHYTNTGWQAGSIAIVIADGEVDATADQSGQVNVAMLSLDAAPIDIPSDVFGTPAQLQDVRLALATATPAATAWTDDNDASATAMFDLDLMWSIEVNGNVAQLGTQHLPAILATVALTGDGEQVDAAIDLQGAGTLWTWAGLLELQDLRLTLAASSN